MYMHGLMHWSIVLMQAQAALGGGGGGEGAVL